ncbi:phage tail protein I [Palleronia sp.]|uniref:phage tail protein I n=1 Tax=Palleronia sp. TaxID=1940284 RepID=UPI0035C804B2
MSVASILPQNATPMERALARATSDELPVEYGQILDPYRTSLDWLPWLAAHHGVPLWFEDWPEARKREITAHSAAVSAAYPGERLCELVGTRLGLKRLLAYVDAEIIDSRVHPARFIIGRAILGQTPINQQPFTGRYLVKVLLTSRPSAHRIGQTALGRGALNGADPEPLRRAKAAMRAAKVPATQYSVTFAWRRRVTLADTTTFDQPPRIDGWTDRTRL